MSWEAAFKHDRLIVILALMGVAAVAWLFMVREARAMEVTGVCCCLGMAMSGPDVSAWSASQVLPLFLMWAEMMVAMMIPSAAPMILTFAMINRKRHEQQRPYVATGLFLLGYLAVWTLFSLVIAIAQWALHGAALISPEMKFASPWLAGVLLICAGLFQWTPWKRACLRHCQSPLEFLLTGWREGSWGALRMGWSHGAYCAGCCWLLMALLFVLGVMNITWIAVITVLVLVEKTVPWRVPLHHAVGVFFVVWGGWMMVRG